MPESQPEGVSVVLIAKNCPGHLHECLGSLRPFIHPELGDEIVVVDTGSTDGKTPKIAEQGGAQVYLHPELNVPGMLDLVKKYLPETFERISADTRFADGFLSDFAAARELANSHAKNDIILWIDSDDVLKGAGKLRTICCEYFREPNHKALFVPYDYSFDSDGACTTVLIRERVVRKSCFFWKGVCHESLLPRASLIPMEIRHLGDPEIRISHKNGSHSFYSDVRNFVIMRRELDEAKWKDPRLFFYMAHCCRGLTEGKPGHHFFAESIRWYRRALETSGSRDDRASCCLNIAYILLIHKRSWEAIDWFDRAIKLWNLDPRGYFGKARCYFELDRFEDCLLWTLLGRGVGQPQLMATVDPQAINFNPMVYESLSLFKLKRYDNALEIAEKLTQVRPNFKPVLDLMNMVKNTYILESRKHILSEAFSLASSPGAARTMLHCLRADVRSCEPQFQLETKPPKLKKHITFLCGKTTEPWTPASLDTGIGGSEQMVIRLARGLAARGWTIDVYGNPDPASAYKYFDGVRYLPAESFNSRFPRDILILWRSPASLEQIALPGEKKSGLSARKVYVDLHDVTSDSDWTSTRLERATGVIFKSRYHRGLAPSIPDAKALVWRNGIDLATLPSVRPRNEKKVFWSSSPDRGLLGALHAWRLVKAACSGAELHVAYGFTPLYLERAAHQEYQFFGDMGYERHMLDYQADVMSLAEELGVILHGRLGHKQLLEHLSESNIWLYPTLFDEISCISAMEAQACGAIPVCSNHAALAETVNWGMTCTPKDPENISNCVLSFLERFGSLDDYRQDMMADAHKRFDLNSLVDTWEREFLK